MKLKKAAAALLIAFAITAGALVSCEKTAPITPNATQNSDSQTSADSAPSQDGSEDEPASEAGKIDGSVDADADSITGIKIKNAGELSKIGNSAKYPIDGDYVLVADIDLTGTKFTPIGGSESECGIVAGKNVFSGTFDGRGHTIVGLDISVSMHDRVHVGLFGSLGSDKKDDPAVVKNLILKNVNVTGSAKGTATYAVLAGQASGYVEIDNISIISGSVSVENESGDILGIGSLVGQCRTRKETGCSNGGIHISNIFTSVSVTGDNNGNAMYTSGLIGRIRGSELGSLKNVLQLGTVVHEGGEGNAITAGDSGVKIPKNIYYLAGCGKPYNDIGQAKSYESLSGGNLTLNNEVWHIEEGLYPLPNITYESPLFSVLDFVSITLANGDTMNKVTSDFTLVDEVMGKAIKWKSDNEKVIRIDGSRASVTRPEYGYSPVKLTARADGIMKTYELNVFSGVVGRIDRDGNTLKAVNYPDGLSYKWIIKNAVSGKIVNTASDKTGTYTLTSKDENGMVTLSVEGYDDAVFFNSSLPIMYIDSKAGYYDVSKNGYAKAELRISTTDEFPNTKYNGNIEIKLRGNSTAYQPKRPFKIKLGEKADLFGMGENKHWCLLANMFDRTNLRNKISYDFSMDLGLTGCESTFVTLIYNGEYYGLYELTEAIRIDDGRVEIFNWEEEAEDVAKAIAKKEGLSKDDRDALEERLTRNLSWITSGKFEEYTISDYVDTSKYDITGGYLIEDDAYFDEVSKFYTKNEMKLMLKNPEYLSTNNDMMNYLEGYIQELEDAIYSPNRLNSKGKHYSEYMDVPSFIDFWMVNTIYKNVELLFKSCYMYKDINNGLITWGPVWDMDWTSGNHVNLDSTSAKTDSWKQGQSQDREYWYKALYNDPWFVLQLYERWGEIGDKIDNMMAQYDIWAEKIASSAEIDNQRWWYDWTVDKEVSTLRDWLNKRIAWMDKQMENPAVLLESLQFFDKSKKIGVTGLAPSADAYELTVTITDESIKSVDIIINGKVTGEQEITNGAIVKIPYAGLRERGKYNSVELIAKDKNGNYMTLRKRGGQNGSSAMEASAVYLPSR